MSPAEKLCLACGLCCDGTLFDNVRLVAPDDATQLRAVGLPVRTTRGRQPVRFFRQPCAALQGDCRCGVYAERPTQCRAFECLVFKRASAGTLTWEAARRKVRQARREAEEIRTLLRRLGDQDEDRSLNERFRRTQQRLEAGGLTAKAAALFGELGLAMHRFQLKAHRSFHTRPEA